MVPSTLQTAEDLLRFREPGKTAERVRGVLVVRAPDAAFVARDRLGRIPEEGYAELAPDWVAEMLTSGDRPAEVLEKVGQWLGAGVRVVWVLDPVREDARIYRADGTVSVVGADGELDGEDVLPGFRCPLRDILQL